MAKKSDVRVGDVWTCVVSGKLTKVKLTREYHGYTNRVGYEGVNLETGRTVRIKSAARLRKLVNVEVNQEGTV